MIKSLEDILERVKSWPKERQDDAARVLEALEQSGTEIYRLTDDERAAVEIGLEQAKRGEFVSDADMEAFWNRKRP
jgi:hypothetical protein